ncbi:MAG TPA: hypothetical protein PKL84_15425, partial [Candidatus Hydrogenedentes bacterium]|nr:hypothetical protein [Candidatus Hydrogenedentota bacterium]
FARTYLDMADSGIKEGVKNYGRGISLFVYLWRDGRMADAGLAPPEQPVPEAAPDSESAATSET